VVHRFVCKGTVEEKIDEMIESKKELSEKVLSGGAETLITELSNEQIHNMFKLTLHEME
jgi:non-specific serine/threonine protein kinase